LVAFEHWLRAHATGKNSVSPVAFAHAALHFSGGSLNKINSILFIEAALAADNDRMRIGASDSDSVATVFFQNALGDFGRTVGDGNSTAVAQLNAAVRYFHG